MKICLTIAVVLVVNERDAYSGALLFNTFALVCSSQLEVVTSRGRGLVLSRANTVTQVGIRVFSFKCDLNLIISYWPICENKDN